jgi:predicted CXXCH cytochrome family protein
MFAGMNTIVRQQQALAATIFLVLAAGAAAAGPATTAPANPHDGISCSMCHGRAAIRALAVTHDTGPDPRSRACRECHRERQRPTGGAGATLGFHGDPTADCAGCHSFHEPGLIKTAVGDIRAGAARLAGALPGHCAACHAEGSSLGDLSPAHRTAAGLYHRDAAQLAEASPSQGCLNCHAAGTDSPWLRETDGQMLTFNLHATHPLGVAVVAGSGSDERTLRTDLDPRLRLFDGRIECQTCHSLTAATADLLVPFEQPYDLCLGCHKLRNAKPSPVPRELMATMMAVE